MIGASSQSDPQRKKPNQNGYNENTSIAGLTSVSPQIATTGTTLLIFAAGQSLVSNFNGPALLNLGVAGFDMMNMTDGSLWQAKEPLLGCDYSLSNPLSYLGKTLRDNSDFSRVILVAVSAGATAISRWAPEGDFHDHITNGVSRIKSLGYFQNSNVKCVFIWSQGISDAIASTTKSDYKTAFQRILSTVTEGGMTGPVFVDLQSIVFSSTTPNATAIRGAQLELINGTTIRQGFDCDSVNAAGRHDGAHFNAASCALWAADYRTKILAALV